MNEKRKSARSDFAWPVCAWSNAHNRFYMGRMVNISLGGALISLPLASPLSPNDSIEVNFPRTAALAKRRGQAGRIKVGTVKRIQRTARDVFVAIEFSEPNPE